MSSKNVLIPFHIANYINHITKDKKFYSNLSRNDYKDGYLMIHCDACDKHLFTMSNLNLFTATEKETFDFNFKITCDCGHTTVITKDRYFEIVKNYEYAGDINYAIESELRNNAKITIENNIHEDYIKLSKEEFKKKYFGI